MKIILNVTLTLIALILFQSCSRKNDDLQNSTQAQTQNVTSGTWKVTLFTDGGNNETSDFSGYSFQFDANGSVIATRNGAAKGGTWAVNNSSKKFLIELGPKTADNKPLGELTEDWKIISISTNEIKLTDDKASSSEFLTFTKN